MPIRTVRLGQDGIHKSSHLGVRHGGEDTAYLARFPELSRQDAPWSSNRPRKRRSPFLRLLH
ncbi:MULTISPECIES: hypothetical protein [Burkholderia]|uniref:hypothetical protein n=1 Tax=Burkholderia TaxID=32008 RepID=UPI00041FC34A|nr:MULTISPECIES: hypothetical protein [Burkholderia]